MIPILDIPTRYSCPNCTAELQLERLPTRPVLHPCRGLRGLLAPMVPAGIKAKVEAHDRDDYVGTDLVQTDGEGRPVMSIVTTRDDGEDCMVLAPTATAHLKEI